MSGMTRNLYSQPGQVVSPVAFFSFQRSDLCTEIESNHESIAAASGHGKAKMISVDEAGGVLQNPAVTPDVTATYCFPLTA
jgi:hypothetical protein